MEREKRRERRRRERHAPVNVAPGGLTTRAYQPLSEEDVQRIHTASLTVLEKTGIQVEASEARDIFEKAGATVDEASGRVYIPCAMVEDAIATACPEFVLAGRDEKHDMLMGGDRVYMGTGGAAVKVIGFDGYVRESQLADIARIGRLVDALDNIHFYLRPVVARDVPPDILDVNKTYAAVTNTTKHVMTPAYNSSTARQVIEMVSMIAGNKEAFEARPIGIKLSKGTLQKLKSGGACLSFSNGTAGEGRQNSL